MEYQNEYRLSFIYKNLITSKSRTFFKITLPMISPTIFYLVITGFIGAFKAYSDAVALFGTNLNAAGMMGLLFFMYSRFVIAPMYSTSTMIYVQNYSSSQRANANADTKSTTPSKAADDTTKKTTNEENQKIYPADISASANLAEICVTLFKNSDEMTALYDGCTVNVDVTDGTFFITITVDGTDAQKCANVANQLAEKAAEVYNSKFSYGQIGTLRQAKVPSAPYAPSNTKNMLIGAAIGLIASCLISILIELIDTTIKSEDDIQDIYGIPIFAEIPDFENQG